MKYERIVRGRFLERLNRFIALVEIDGTVEKCHVKNTGRCRELLVKNATVFLEPSDNPKRLTNYSLVGVIKDGFLINMDSQAPNEAAYEWVAGGGLFSNVTYVRREVSYGNSRFDLYARYIGEESAHGSEREAFIEVKGVTLERDRVALFPDAPTARGCKHINELIKAQEEGYDAYLLFVIQMKGIRYFTPNEETDRPFAKALRTAYQCGVKIAAVDCRVKLGENQCFTMEIDDFVEVRQQLLE